MRAVQTRLLEMFTKLFCASQYARTCSIHQRAVYSENIIAADSHQISKFLPALDGIYAVITDKNHLWIGTHNCFSADRWRNLR